MIKYISIIFLSLLPVLGIGQDSFKCKYPKYRIGVSPTSLLHWMKSVQISNDFGVLDNLNISLETGYVFQGEPFRFAFERWNPSSREKTSGLNNRLGLEAYVFRSPDTMFSLGIAFNYNVVKVSSYEWQPRGGYEERVKVNRKYTYSIAHYIMSYHIKASDRVMIDVGGGLGLGTKFTSDENIEADFIADMFFNFNVSYAFVK